METLELDLYQEFGGNEKVCRGPSSFSLACVRAAE